jgi:hypothetical protein
MASKYKSLKCMGTTVEVPAAGVLANRILNPSILRRIIGLLPPFELFGHHQVSAAVIYTHVLNCAFKDFLASEWASVS